ncbi:FliM/FliN family flagellar motor switch protein [Aquisphaera giovannonii]|uniref:FliM/FliN family flagellar motor switch protein n=1 Tax=Aquisphaera giovannonii TaxID=406548 RepID=UPI0011E06CE9|nr:FliM/FliN family flagellar motor switch protein [Aquisphaera giovannonii]
MPTEANETLATPDPDGSTGPGPLGELWAWLPRLGAREVRLAGRLRGWSGAEGPPAWLARLRDELELDLEIGAPELVWRASGLRRPGLISQLRWPRLGTRLGVGLEVALAHAVVDQLLGYDRPLAESRLQLSPVEWGVWGYLASRALESMADPAPDAAGRPASELRLDRVGPDPFDPTGLGAMVTVLWAVRAGSTTGTARLWVAEQALGEMLDAGPGPAPATRPLAPGRAGSLASLWVARAGSVAMPLGLRRLRVGGVLPLADSRLSGTPQSPSGPVRLACDLSGSGERLAFPAEPVAGSGGRLVRLAGPLEREPRPREALNLGTNATMTTDPRPAPSAGGATPNPDVDPLDVPVTLAVELGRVNLPLSRLADLKPGDVVELGRHSREPVELTSNGRLVGRGELVLIDTELGVRVTHVFL